MIRRPVVPSISVFVFLSSLLGAACDLNRFAADQTVKVIDAGGEGASGFWDYEVAGQAMPGAIMQGETLLHVSPDNERLLLGMARTYVSYNFGWLQYQWERADEAGDFDKADRLAYRMQRFYTRAMKLAMRALRMRDDEEQLDQVLESGDVEQVRAYLKRVFTDEEDVASLYWAGLAWGSVMASSGGSIDDLADAPMARSLIERSVELDPTFQDGGGLGVLGTVEAAFPQLFGGDLDKAKEYYERALSVSDRKNLLLLVGYAKGYAVGAQDRELFVSLLREVIQSPDQGNHLRLSNKVARVRAEYYLAHVDEWFMPTE